MQKYPLFLYLDHGYLTESAPIGSAGKAPRRKYVKLQGSRIGTSGQNTVRLGFFEDGGKSCGDAGNISEAF